MQAPKLLIYILASVGGLVDAVGFLILGHLFTAHMSGNSAALGAYFGQGHWSWGVPHLFAIPVFVLGIVAGHLWLTFAPGAQGASFLLLIEAALLAIFAIVHVFFESPARDTLRYFALCLLPLLAMGIQNAPTRTIGKTTFHTTYVTGVLDTLGESLARFFIGWRKGASEGSEHLVTAWRAAAVWMCYAMGALAGSAGLLLLRSAILVVPICLLVFVSAVLVRIRPTVPPPSAPVS
jgi:uncharacterized membrane protein YoaK (UPF0700 family)